MTRPIEVAVLAASLVLAAGAGWWAGQQGDAGAALAVRTRPPALAGDATVAVSDGSAVRGDHLVSGAAGLLWTTTSDDVRITDVHALGADGIALGRLMLVESDQDNPGFGGAADASLQAMVDARVGEGKVTLQPARGAVLRCCGTQYDLYVDAEVASDASAGLLLGVRLWWKEPDGARGTTDIVTPISFCRAEPDDGRCASIDARVDRALHGT